MDQNTKLFYCFLGGIASLIFVASLVFSLAEKSDWLHFGPGDKFVVASITINTIGRYIGLLFVIALLEAAQTVIDIVSFPILNFTIFNPDKDEIVGFTSFGLQFKANIIMLTGNLKGICMMLVAIAQIDVAIFTVIIGRVVGGMVIYINMRGKKFTPRVAEPDACLFELIPDSAENVPLDAAERAV